MQSIPVKRRKETILCHSAKHEKKKDTTQVPLMTDICRKKVQLICEMHPNSCRHSVYMHPCVTIKSHLKTCYCIRLLGNTCPSIRTSTEPQKCVGKPHPYISMYTIDGSHTCCNAMQAYRHERNKQCSSGPVYFLLYDTTPLLTGTKVLG